MVVTELTSHGAVQLSKLIRSGSVSSVEIVRGFLDAIEGQEEVIKAWEFLDPEYALYQAGQADKRLAEGRQIGPLHGLPVGVKDVFDTYDMPTENGTVLHAGRQPASDAFVVSLLREAGAVIMGKTVTTELAYYSPGKTTNPHDAGHTPGGSSSGSAAAVAAGMVPMALGTQTNGSMIRPASFCGVIGFKPTRGLISRTGVLRQSFILDQVGVFANSVEDAALAAETLMALDTADPSMKPFARPRLLEGLAASNDVRNVGFVRSPLWENADMSAREGIEGLVNNLGNAFSVDLPDLFGEAVEMHKTIMDADFALNFHDLYERGKESLSPMFRGAVERGKGITAVAYNRAIESITYLNQQLEVVFSEYDVILTPATSGSAPEGLETTGSPIFCSIWTLCGVPAISLPLLQDRNGMPMGVQLVGRRGEDAKLLRVGRWLCDKLKNSK